MVECQIEQERQDKERLEKLYDDQQSILSLYLSFVAKEKAVLTWTAKELQLVLKALCQNKCKKILTKKQELVAFHEKWKTHTPLLVNEVFTIATGHMVSGINI